MTAAENARPEAVSPSPASGRDTTIPPAAVAALNALLAATDGLTRIRALADITKHLADKRAAIYDGTCGDGTTGKVMPLLAFYQRCLRGVTNNPTHTPDTCRWAVPGDQPYERWPIVANVWFPAADPARTEGP